MQKVAYQIEVKGLVQGVGFRPFVYRLAARFGLAGWVENRNDCVQIKVQGSEGNIRQFINSIKEEAPVASNIASVTSHVSHVEAFSDFRIIKSTNVSDETTEISPDIAVCSECLEDMKRQPNRIDYPFINCTNCGPRFSIIKDLPYDREKTTMKDFIMCGECKHEYTDVLDRRFHAQPVACVNCGPQYELIHNNETVKDFNLIIKTVKNLIVDGKIVAMKGMGGFHIACDATNEKAVKRLRELKNRDGKPFAVMFRNIDKLKEYTEVSEEEEQSLLSWKRPIVLLKQKKQLAGSVSVGFNTIGAMLPYMPFHHLLFETLELPAIVLTSGNISEEPIVIDNAVAIRELSKISDALLVYNRDIYNRTDDSVVAVMNHKERIVRRSRGYVPSPVRLKLNVDGIVATGAELVNCFCMGKGQQAILSQHIGDLKNMETLQFYEETIEQFKKLFRVKPTLIVNDMHPDYLSTKYADNTHINAIKVQHHHAHVASCMAEHDLDEEVIGVSFDGTGYGDDGNIWGGEFLLCNLHEYKRYTHFGYVPMPGGDKVTKEPWRMAVSYLYKAYNREFLNFDLPFLKNIKRNDIEMLLVAIDKKINVPLTSSAGRLFDAVAALINLCPVSSFHAEAPMRLEAVIDDSCRDKYNYSIGQTVSFEDTFKEIVKDIQANVPVSVIAAKFHNTVIAVILAVVNEMAKRHHVNKVVLSGGTFQNRYILEKTEDLLLENNYEVYTHSKIPTNDGGIALGQLVIAAKKRAAQSL